MQTRDTADSFDFDAALSFAGEDREYVEDVNRALKEAGVGTFLDSDYLAETWGEDLIEFFDGVYRRRSRFAILFISRHYSEKVWPRYERRSALARALEERAAYVLPVRLDDTIVEGLRPTVGYLDARRIGIDGLVAALLAKLAGRSVGGGSMIGDRVPRTKLEAEAVRTNRPPAWEYLYFAGILHLEKEVIEERYLDHELGYAESSGEQFDDITAIPFLNRAFDEASRLTRLMTSLMEPDILERAFGKPGETGDSDRIRHLAVRWNSVYSDLMKWSARIRGASHRDRFDNIFELEARFVGGPIQQYRDFVEHFIDTLDGVPQALAAGENLKIEMTLTLTIEDGLVEEYNLEMARLQRELLH